MTSKAPPLAMLTAWAAATTVAKAGSIAKGVKLSLLLNWEMVAWGSQVDMLAFTATSASFSWPSKAPGTGAAPSQIEHAEAAEAVADGCHGVAAIRLSAQRLKARGEAAEEGRPIGDERGHERLVLLRGGAAHAGAVGIEGAGQIALGGEASRNALGEAIPAAPGVAYGNGSLRGFRGFRADQEAFEGLAIDFVG